MAFLAGAKSWAECASRISRIVLLTGIAVVAALILTASPQQRASMNPLSINPANATGSVCAAPNYLALTAAGGNQKLYLVDTNKKVICVYRIQSASVRLTAARKFDKDELILDSSLPLMNGKALEGSDGATRDQADKYGQDVQKLIESSTGKKKL
jgi:hypothetical protein